MPERSPKLMERTECCELGSGFHCPCRFNPGKTVSIPHSKYYGPLAIKQAHKCEYSLHVSMSFFGPVAVATSQGIGNGGNIKIIVIYSDVLGYFKFWISLLTLNSLQRHTINWEINSVILRYIIIFTVYKTQHSWSWIHRVGTLKTSLDLTCWQTLSSPQFYNNFSCFCSIKGCIKEKGDNMGYKNAAEWGNRRKGREMLRNQLSR